MATITATATATRHTNLHDALGLLTKAGELVTAALGEGTVSKAVRDAYVLVRDAERAAAADLQREAKSARQHGKAGVTSTNTAAQSTAVEPPIPADADLAKLDEAALLRLCKAHGVTPRLGAGKSMLRRQLAERRDGAAAPVTKPAAQPQTPAPTPAVQPSANQVTKQAAKPAAAPKADSKPAAPAPKADDKPAVQAPAAKPEPQPAPDVVTKDKLLAEYAALGGNAGLAKKWGVAALQRNVAALRAKAPVPAAQPKPAARVSHKLFRSNGDLASLADVAAYLVGEFGMAADEVQSALEMLTAASKKAA